VIFPGGSTPTGKRIFLMVLFRQENHHRQGKIYFPDGKKSTGKTGTGRKKRFFYGVQTVRVNDIIACWFCTAKEFYFLVGNPFFLTVSTVREKRFFLTVLQLTCGLSTVRKLKSYFPDGTPSGK